MINYTKKWWLLRCLRRAIAIHTLRGDYVFRGEKVVLSQQFFVAGNSPEISDHWNGLANKYPGNVSTLKSFKLWKDAYIGFRFSWLLFWNKEYSIDKLKKKIHKYNEIFEVCRDEGYITMKSTENGMLAPSVSNHKADNIKGFPLGYFNGLLEEYDTFTKFFIAFISSGVTLFLIQSLIQYFLKFIL